MSPHKLRYWDGETHTVNLEQPIPVVLLVHHPLRGANAFVLRWEDKSYVESPRFEEIRLRLP